MKQLRAYLVIVMCLGLAACQSAPSGMSLPDHAPKSVRVGKPYTIKGETYYPSYNPTYNEVGIASWYGPGFHGKKTANGETYDQYAMTAAHPTLPLPSLVRVTNLTNGQSTIVRINDRGPFAEGRIIDLSKRAAETIGIKGISKVRVTYLPDETERYWASGNMDTMQIAAQKRRQDSADEDRALEHAAYDDGIKAQPAPIISVSSTTVAPLPPIGSKHKVNILSQDAAHAPAYPQVPEPHITPKATQAWQQQRDMGAPRSSVLLSRNQPINTVDPPAARSGFAIQAGAFSSHENAKRLSERLSTIGSSFIDPLERAGTTLYRVRVGPYDSHSLASDQLHQLYRMGIKDAKVVSIE